MRLFGKKSRFSETENAKIVKKVGFGGREVAQNDYYQRLATNKKSAIKNSYKPKIDSSRF